MDSIEKAAQSAAEKCWREIDGVSKEHSKKIQRIVTSEFAKHGEEIETLKLANKNANAMIGANCEELQAIIAKRGESEQLLIAQRDAAEQALSQAYFLITGKSPEWSNNFGYTEALTEINDAQTLLRKTIKLNGDALTKTKIALSILTDFGSSIPNKELQELVTENDIKRCKEALVILNGL